MLPEDQRFHPVTLNNSWVVEYATDQGGILRIDPARIDAGFCLAILPRPTPDKQPNLICRVRLADDQGRLWQSESAFAPSVLLQHLLDLDRKTPPRLASHIPQEWADALDGPCLAKRASDGYDHRAYRYFYLDGRAWFVRFKHQGADHDVYLVEGTRLLVRTVALYAEGWNPLLVEDEAGGPLPAGAPYRMPEEEDEKAFAAWEDSEEAADGTVPDLVHEMDVRPLLFRNRLPLMADAYWDNDLPDPTTFRRVEGEGTPQPAVSFRPPCPPLPHRQSAPGRFTGWVLENNHDLALRTSAGGILTVQKDYLIRAEGRFEIAPGSESELVDVIRGRVRLADEQGGLWEAVAHFTPEAFVEGMIALLPGDHPRFLEGEVKGGSDPLLAGVRGLLDDGGWRHFLVGEWAVSVCFANQKPRFALFAGPRVEVQASGLVGYRRAIHLENEHGFITWRAEQPSDGLRQEELPPIIFEMSHADLLFRNTTFAVDDGFWHMNDLPIPVIFDRLDTTGEPQEGVALQTSHSSQTVPR
jgi:hypothetical protein